MGSPILLGLQITQVYTFELVGHAGSTYGVMIPCGIVSQDHAMCGKLNHWPIDQWLRVRLEIAPSCWLIYEPNTHLRIQQNHNSTPYGPTMSCHDYNDYILYIDIWSFVIHKWYPPAPQGENVATSVAHVICQGQEPFGCDPRWLEHRMKLRKYW